MTTTIDATEIMAERREWWGRRRETVNRVCAYLGISKSELARALGLTPQSMSDRLAGRTKLEPWEIAAIAHFIGIPEYVLWYEPTDAVRWLLDHPEGIRIGSRCTGECPGHDPNRHALHDLLCRFPDVVRTSLVDAYAKAHTPARIAVA